MNIPQKNLISIRRSTVYVVGIILAISISRPVYADDLVGVTKIFSETDVLYGSTIELANKAKVGIYPNALPNVATVIFAPITTDAPSWPDYLALNGQVYSISTDGVSGWTANLDKTAAIALPFSAHTYSKRIWMYDQAEKKWQPLKTSLYKTRQLATANAKSTNAYYAVFNDRRTEEGVASWYCKNHCSKKYPTLHGTSNNYPVGSYVTVTSLENNKSVRVKIISKWGQPDGRVVDLSWAAFTKIKGENSGLTRVKVTSIVTAAKPITASTEVTLSDLTPAMKVTSVDSEPAPAVTSISYAVYDEGSKTLLAGKNEANVRSIASLTKLITAAVYLDTKPDLSKTVTYQRSDVTPYGYLRLKYGDKITAQDALNALLVGSANNAATVLARTSGITYEEFINRMNAKAKSYGCQNTNFVDLHGLSYLNRSTAYDLSLISAHIFANYQKIKSITSKKTYDFTTINTKVKHHLVSTDKLLVNGPIPPNLTFSGAKTGYIDEALYTYTIRFKTSNGSKIIVSLLGAPSASIRYKEATNLATWALAHHSWSL